MEKSVEYLLDRFKLVDGKVVVQGSVTEIKVWGSMVRQYVGAYQPDDAGQSWTYEANIPCDFVVTPEDLSQGTVGVVAEVSRRLADAFDTELQHIVVRHEKRLDEKEENHKNGGKNAY